MGDLTEAGPWLDRRLWNHATVLEGELAEPPTRETLSPATLAWLALLAAEVRADERAKVSEEIATAIEARKRPGITAMLEGGWNHALDVAAGVARETASACPPDPSHRQNVVVPGEQQQDGTGNPAESHGDGRKGAGEIGGKHDASGLATGGVYTGLPIPLGTHGCVLEPTSREEGQT